MRTGEVPEGIHGRDRHDGGADGGRLPPRWSNTAGTWPRLTSSLRTASSPSISTTTDFRNSGSSGFPATDVLSQLQEQIDMLGMTNKEQFEYNMLKQAGVSATSDFRQQIAGLADQLYDLQEQTRYLDDVRDALADTFVDFISGAKSAKEAFGDFADYLFKRSLQMLADKALENLFKGFGSSGSGSTDGAGGKPPERHRRPVRRRESHRRRRLQRHRLPGGRAGAGTVRAAHGRRHRPGPAPPRPRCPEAAPSSRTTPSCCRGAWTTARRCGSRRPPAMARPMPSGGTADDVLRHHDPARARFRVPGAVPCSTPDPPAGERQESPHPAALRRPAFPTSAR